MARTKEFDKELALDAAVAVFREHGFDGTSTEHACARHEDREAEPIRHLRRQVEALLPRRGALLDRRNQCTPRNAAQGTARGG